MGAVNMPNGFEYVVGVYALDVAGLTDEDAEEYKRELVADSIVDQEVDLDYIREYHHEIEQDFIGYKYELMRNELERAVDSVISDRFNLADIDTEAFPFEFVCGLGYYSGVYFALEGNYGGGYEPTSETWWENAWDGVGSWYAGRLNYYQWRALCETTLDVVKWVMTEYVKREHWGYVSGRGWTSTTKPFNPDLELECVEQPWRWAWRYPEYAKDVAKYGAYTRNDPLEMRRDHRPHYTTYVFKQEMKAKEV